MAVIQVYGREGCPHRASALDYLTSKGAKVLSCALSFELPSLEVLSRAVGSENGSELFDRAAASDAGIDAAACSKDELVCWLADKPTAISAPLAVRGCRVVLGADPGRLQSLMY